MSHSLFLNKFDTRYYDKDDVPDKKSVGERLYDDITVGLRSEMLITRWERWIIMAGSDLDFSRSKVTVFNPIYESPSQFSFGSFIQSKYFIGNGWSMGLDSDMTSGRWTPATILLIGNTQTGRRKLTLYI